MIKIFGLVILLSTACVSGAADLTRATVVAPASFTGPERKAVALLIDSVAERSRIRWPLAAVTPGTGKPVLTIHVAAASAKLPAEGYQLRSFDNGGAPGVEITGNDERGVLFGVGGLLRVLEMR